MQLLNVFVCQDEHINNYNNNIKKSINITPRRVCSSMRMMFFLSRLKGKILILHALQFLAHFNYANCVYVDTNSHTSRVPAKEKRSSFGSYSGIGVVHAINIMATAQQTDILMAVVLRRRTAECECECDSEWQRHEILVRKRKLAACRRRKNSL